MSISKKLKGLILVPIVLLVSGFGYVCVNNYIEYKALKIFNESVI